MTIIIGERQTVDQAKHPELGEGRAVYRNGPAAFIADNGDSELFKKIDLGGSGAEGSYLRAYRADGTVCKLETTKRQRGDEHRRAATPEGVHGWLVAVERPIDDPRTPFWEYRWEPDGGKARKMYVTTMEVGPPGALKKAAKRKSKKFLPDEERWRTFTLTEGPPFVWCNEKDAPAKPSTSGNQLSLA